MTAHDGFTLNDVVTYNEKHNEANGEDNKDGSSNNMSWNCGVEGPTDDPEINALRERQIRNMLATLLLSRGTPMLLAGDEFARTQQGNNNAYCQDNEISWLNWDLQDRGRSLVRFVARLAAARRRYPVLHRSRWLTAEWNEELGVKDMTWLTPTDDEMMPEQWEDVNTRCFGLLLDGRAQPTGIRRRGQDLTILLILNSHHDVVPFKLREVIGGQSWKCVIDTNRPDREGEPIAEFGSTYEITGRSLRAVRTGGRSFLSDGAPQNRVRLNPRLTYGGRTTAHGRSASRRRASPRLACGQNRHRRQARTAWSSAIRQRMGVPAMHPAARPDQRPACRGSPAASVQPIRAANS